MATNKGAELLESLKTQELSQQEMLNRLDAIVDAESARPEGKQDRELIQACIDLQWFLTTGEHYTSEKEVARLKLDSALHKREKQTANGHGHSAKVLAAVFCLVAVVIVLPITGQTLLSRKWIEGQTVDGGEVYRLNGNEVDPGMMKEAIAENSDDDISIITSDREMIAQIPGVREIMLNYIPKGWKNGEYKYSKINGTQFYTEQYFSEGRKKTFLYQCVQYENIESVSDEIQQSSNGKVVKVGNIEVYVSKNIDVVVASWIVDLRSYTLFFPDSEETDRIIESVVGVKNEN